MPSYLESYEDNIKIDKDKCVFCGKCADRCILDNLRLNVAPCRQACPMGVNVQGYVQLIKRGNYDKAREIVREKLPFPEIVCMVCHHPCEQNCEQNKTSGTPVSIRALKRFLFAGSGPEAALEKDKPTGKKIAVIGAGPAGLVAAYDLALKGHAVTVYEAGEKPGGMLRGGIPAFRLPDDVVERELSILPSLGVDIRTGCRVGKDVGLKTIMNSHDSVVLSAGMWNGKKLGVPGENLDGVYDGISFLVSSRQGKGPKLSGRVLVSGGGNMAVDAAMTALRQGADKVIVLALEDEGKLPAFDAEIKQAMAEGVVFKHSCGIESVEGKNGKVGGVTLQRCLSVFDENGGFAPRFSEEREKLEADCLITAIGLDREQELLADSGLGLADVRGADELTLQCKSGKVFVAGDYLGAGSVIKAMAMGREAALSAHRYAMNEHLRFERAYPGPFLTDFPIKHIADERSTPQAPVIKPAKGKGDYSVSEQAFTETQAKAEASRCHSCGGPQGKNRTCWFCLPCEVDCQEKALWVEIPYLIR